MKKLICTIALVFIFLWYYIKADIKRIFRRLLNRRTIVIFIIVFILLSSEIWVPYLIYFITGSNLCLCIGSTCWAFWLQPFTPFLELCIALTLVIDNLWRRNYAKIRSR